MVSYIREFRGVSGWAGFEGICEETSPRLIGVPDEGN